MNIKDKSKNSQNVFRGGMLHFLPPPLPVIIYYLCDAEVGKTWKSCYLLSLVIKSFQKFQYNLFSHNCHQKEFSFIVVTQA